MNNTDLYSENIIAQARKLLDEQDIINAFQLLSEPLHEALYERQDFKLLDELSTEKRLVLAFDYVNNQVTQGGFIQLIQNGYVSLLVTVIEALQEMEIGAELIPVLDDVLKVFVLNEEVLARETSVEEFSKLYAEFKEFEILDTRFIEMVEKIREATVRKVLEGADFAHSK